MSQKIYSNSHYATFTSSEQLWAEYYSHELVEAFNDNDVGYIINHVTDIKTAVKQMLISRSFLFINREKLSDDKIYKIWREADFSYNNAFWGKPSDYSPNPILILSDRQTRKELEAIRSFAFLEHQYRKTGDSSLLADLVTTYGLKPKDHLQESLF